MSLGEKLDMSRRNTVGKRNPRRAIGLIQGLVLKNRSSCLMEVEYRLKTRSRMLRNLQVRYCEGENTQVSTYLDDEG